MSKKPHIPPHGARPEVRTVAVPASSAPPSTPLVDITKDAYNRATVAQLHLFSRDGVDYHMPASVSANLAIEMLKRTSEDAGGEATMWWLLNEMLGEQAVEALRTYEGLTLAHLGQLFDACVQVITGSLTDPKSLEPGAV